MYWSVIMQTIINDIKNHSFHKIYLLCGEEGYLKRSYKNQLKAAIVGQDDNMNYNYFEGKGIPVREVIDIAETLPFFSDFRLIILENSGFFKSANEEMNQYIRTVPESTIFIFVEEEVDKRSKLYKAVKEIGAISEMNRQTDMKLVQWTAGLLKREEKKIREHDMQLFLSKTGNDMGNIKNELEKLISYTLGREIITAQDIEEICTGQISNKIFDMIHAISERQQKKALDLYYDLLTLKEPPMRILFLIEREYRLLWRVKKLSSQGMDSTSIAKKSGLQSFLVGKYSSQAKKMREDLLIQALKDCAETEEAVKTGRINDQMGVEILIMKYSKA